MTVGRRSSPVETQAISQNTCKNTRRLLVDTLPEVHLGVFLDESVVFAGVERRDIAGGHLTARHVAIAPPFEPSSACGFDKLPHALVAVLAAAGLGRAARLLQTLVERPVTTSNLSEYTHKSQATTDCLWTHAPSRHAAVEPGPGKRAGSIWTCPVELRTMTFGSFCGSLLFHGATVIASSLSK